MSRKLQHHHSYRKQSKANYTQSTPCDSKALQTHVRFEPLQDRRSLAVDTPLALGDAIVDQLDGQSAPWMACERATSIGGSPTVYFDSLGFYQPGTVSGLPESFGPRSSKNGTALMAHCSGLG